MAERQRVSRGEILTAQPILQLCVPLGLQWTLCELHHQQCPFHVEPVEEALVTGSVNVASPMSVSLKLLLHQVLPGAPEQALQYALSLLDVDAFDGVRLKQEPGQLLEAGWIKGDRRDGGQVLTAVVLLLQSWTHLKWVGLVEELIDQDSSLELVKFAILRSWQNLRGQSGVVTFDARVRVGRGSILGRSTLGLGKVADEEPWQVTLTVYSTWTITGACVTGALLGILGGLSLCCRWPAVMRHQQKVFEAQVTVCDPMLLQVLQAVAELQEEEAYAALVYFWLTLMERLPLPNKVSSCLLRDLRSDDHHSLSVWLLARRRRGRLMQWWSRCCWQRDLIGRQHALGDTSKKVATVLLEVEVGRHALQHWQTVEMALFGLRGWTLTDLERYKHKVQREEGMKQGRRKGTGGGIPHTETGREESQETKERNSC